MTEAFGADQLGQAPTERLLRSASMSTGSDPHQTASALPAVFMSFFFIRFNPI
jgi:hypothetical protein